MYIIYTHTIYIYIYICVHNITRTDDFCAAKIFPAKIFHCLIFWRRLLKLKRRSSERKCCSLRKCHRPPAPRPAAVCMYIYIYIYTHTSIYLFYVCIYIYIHTHISDPEVAHAVSVLRFAALPGLQIK